MNMIERYKKEIIVICVIIEIILVPLIVRNIISLKNKDNNDNSISSFNEVGKQEFGIMYRDSDTDQYKTYSGSIMDAINNSYELNIENSKCNDGSGASVEPGSVLSISGSTVTIKSNKTVYCTLYFDLVKLKITNANKVCDLGTSMSVEFTTSDPVTEYYYSTNGKEFIKSSENIYSLQGIKDGSTQTIYAYAKSSDGTQSATKEFSFTTQSLSGAITAAQIKASNPKDLSPSIQGDMYRYQAAPASADEAAKMTNWIMFGEECTNDYMNLSEADKIDKYMYRIIGITPSGEMKLIKETFLKEGNTSEFVQNDRCYVDPEDERYCTDGKCPDWPDSELFKRLNGTSNGTQTGSGSTLDTEWTDIFVDSEKYDYLRSGDKINGGTSASTWYNLISDHQWLYGDTKDSSALGKYNGDAVYAIESGAIDATHYVGTKGNITEATYNWKDNPPLTAKIGLMYMYDYYYSYYDGVDEKTRGNAGSSSKLKYAWLHFQRDGYNTSASYEWLMSHYGGNSARATNVHAFRVFSTGNYGSAILYYAYGVRPVFYLSSAAKILGDGTKSSPYKVINN